MAVDTGRRLTINAHRSMILMVIHMNDAQRNSTKAITVRIPQSEYEALRDYSRKRGVSLNMVVADAIARHTAMLEREAVLDDIAAFQKRLGRTTEPTSVEHLREIRRSRTVPRAPDNSKEDADR